MTTDTKEDRTLSGTLLRPLAVGSDAVIFHQGKVTRTAPIVAICRRTAEEVCFETAVTRYHLLTGPDTQPAASPIPLALAA